MNLPAASGAGPNLAARGWPALLCLAGGAAQALALAPQPRWWLQILGAAVLAAATAATPARVAFRRGWLFGWAWIGVAVWWLFVSMHRYGGLPAPVAALAVAALAAALALYLGVAMALLSRVAPDGGWRHAAGFTGAWLLAELARAAWFTGFPWGASGYAHAEGPLASGAPWIGVYGTGAVAAVVAGALGTVAAGCWRERRQGLRALVRRPGLGHPVGLLSMVAVPLAGMPMLAQDFTTPAGTLSVSLLQTNVAQDEKFALSRLPQTLADLDEALAAAPGRLIIAPETAVPLLPRQLEELQADWWPRQVRRFRDGRHALLGIPLGDEQRGYTNSALVLGGGTVQGQYDKVHLVPFGEFIPPGFRWFTEAMNIPLGDFARGSPAAPALPLGDQRVAPTICYEDLFGEELARRFGPTASAPTLLANLSNIAWFGRTVAIDQHLQISRMRTLEFQRPMVRATNTGATAVIDHRGQVVALLPPHQRGTLTHTVEGRDGLTPFARWASRTGLWPLWGAALLLLAIAAIRVRARVPGPGATGGPT